MESGQIAADDTVYDNGYGICMIPHTHVTFGAWNASAGYSGYKSSYMHNTVLPNIVTKLKNVLGSHLVQRNVLLSSGVNRNTLRSNAYTWTTAYATLMSVGQMTGTFASNYNKYDDGEANYKLPIFNYTDYKTGTAFWLRGSDGNSWYVSVDGSISTIGYAASYGVRPLIYLR